MWYGIVRGSHPSPPPHYRELTPMTPTSSWDYQKSHAPNQRQRRKHERWLCIACILVIPLCMRTGLTRDHSPNCNTSLYYCDKCYIMSDGMYTLDYWLNTFSLILSGWKENVSLYSGTFWFDLWPCHTPSHWTEERPIQFIQWWILQSSSFCFFLSRLVSVW